MADLGIQVIVKFPTEIPSEMQGPLLMLIELAVRTVTKLDVRAVKDLQGDDSKLRRLMTIKQRDAL